MGKANKRYNNNKKLRRDQKKKEEIQEELLFIQEMFSQLDPSVVEMVFEGNDFDQDKTINQLEELGSSIKLPTHDSPTTSVADEWEHASDIEVSVEASAPLNEDWSREEIEKAIVESVIASSNQFETYEDLAKSNLGSPYELGDHVELLNNEDSSATEPLLEHSGVGEALEDPQAEQDRVVDFLSSMFPVEEDMIRLLLEEYKGDVARTSESLLSIVFVKESNMLPPEEGGEKGDAPPESADAPPQPAAEIPDETEPLEEHKPHPEVLVEIKEDLPQSTTTQASNEIDLAEYDEEEQMRRALEMSSLERFAYLSEDEEEDVCRLLSVDLSTLNESELKKYKIQSLADMFPGAKRAELKAALDYTDFDLQQASAHLLTLMDKQAGPKPVRPVIPLTQNFATVGNKRGSWQGAGSSIKQPPKVAYKSTASSVAPPPSYSEYKPLVSEKHPPQEDELPKIFDNETKIKLQRVKDQFRRVDDDVVASLFLECNYNIQQTLAFLYDLFPITRRASEPTTNRPVKDPAWFTAPSPVPQAWRNPNQSWRASEAATSSRNTSIRSTAASSSTTTSTTTTTTTTSSYPTTTTSTADSDDLSLTDKRSRKGKAKDPQPAFTVVESKKKKHAGQSDEYNSSREALMRYAAERNSLLRAATAAFVSGNGAKAREFAQRGRIMDDLVYESYNSATKHIQLTSSRANNRIDLHGYQVKEALLLLRRLVDSNAEMGRTTSNEPRYLEIITGQGLHSAGGVAKIRPAVQAYLKSTPYRFYESNPGAFVVAFHEIVR